MKTLFAILDEGDNAHVTAIGRRLDAAGFRGPDVAVVLHFSRTPATADSHSRAIIALTAGGAKMFPALRCAQIVTKYTPPPA